MKSSGKVCFLTACIAGIFCLSLSTASATILLEDTFADGSRGETSLPTQSAVWVSHPDDVTMGVGSLAYAQTTSSHKLWTYFADDGSPVNLSIGQQLVATINFIPTGLYTNASENFRFGLFHDPTDGHITQDINSDSGGAGDPWTDSTGYAIRTVLSAGAGDNPQIGKRTDLLNTSLLGSSGAYTWDSGGADVENMVDGALYTAQLELDYVAAGQMDITFTLSDTGGTLTSHSMTDATPYTTFDQMFFRLSSAAGTADVLDFKEFKVEVIPEPATLGLIGIGGLALLGIRRRFLI